MSNVTTRQQNQSLVFLSGLALGSAVGAVGGALFVIFVRAVQRSLRRGNNDHPNFDLLLQ